MRTQIMLTGRCCCVTRGRQERLWRESLRSHERQSPTSVRCRGMSIDSAYGPIPNGPFAVSIDGAYAQNWEAKQPNVEVIIGQKTLAFRQDDGMGHVTTAPASQWSPSDTDARRTTTTSHAAGGTVM